MLIAFTYERKDGSPSVVPFYTPAEKLVDAMRDSSVVDLASTKGKAVGDFAHELKWRSRCGERLVCGQICSVSGTVDVNLVVPF